MVKFQANSIRIAIVNKLPMFEHQSCSNSGGEKMPYMIGLVEVKHRSSKDGSRWH